jgi:hypothetical protein
MGSSYTQNYIPALDKLFGFDWALTVTNQVALWHV